MKNFKEEGGMPIVIVTYSGMPRDIEPASGKRRIETLQKLSEAEIPTILSMRPMIKGINTDDENIRRVAKDAGSYPYAITVGGLYVYQPETIESFKKAGYDLDDIYKKHKYSVAKVLSNGVKERVREIMKKHWKGLKKIKGLELASVYYFNHNTSYGPHFLGSQSSVYLRPERYKKTLEKVRNFNVKNLEAFCGKFEEVMPKYKNDFLGTGKSSENRINNFIQKNKRLKEEPIDKD